MNILTVSEVRYDCQGLCLVARIEASIIVFGTKPVLYRPVLGQIQFCSFDRGCLTCLDTKPVLYQGRFCCLTYASQYIWLTLPLSKMQRRRKSCTIYCYIFSFGYNRSNVILHLQTTAYDPPVVSHLPDCFTSNGYPKLQAFGKSGRRLCQVNICIQCKTLLLTYTLIQGL